MKHVKFEGLMSPYEKTVRVAEYAVDLAKQAINAPNGTGVYRNDDGSMTIIGGGQYGGGGIPNGIIPWVGDEVAPGKPTGLSAVSAWGTIYVSWEGTLEGGVPDDFDHVAISIDGTELAYMTGKTTVALSGFKNDQVVTLTFIAYDAARNIHGMPDPNGSEPVTLEVTVSDAREEIDEKVEEATENAQNAADRADELAGQVNDISVTVGQYATQIEGAIETANESLTQSASVSQELTGFKQEVAQTYVNNDALNDAIDKEVLDRNTAIEQSASGILSTVSSTYATQKNIDDAIEQEVLDRNSAIQQSADSITSTVSQTYASKTDVSDAVGNILDDVAKQVDADLDAFTEQADLKYASSAAIEQKADEILQTVSETYITDDEVEQSYVTKTTFEQESNAIKTSVSEAATVAGEAYEKSTSLEQTASDLTFRINGVESTATTASTNASQALTKANDASDTAESAQQTAEDAEAAAYDARNTATNAAKTATNYINLSSSGVIVGNQTGSSLQGNTLIRADGLDIRDGTTILASFDSDEINLGYNSTSSSLKMCGGQGQMIYRSSSTVQNGVTIPAGLEIRGEKGIRFTTRYRTTAGYLVVFYVNAYSDNTVGLHYVARVGFDRNQIWYFYNNTSTTAQMVFSNGSDFSASNDHVVGFKHAGSVLAGPTLYHGNVVINFSGSSYFGSILTTSQQSSTFGRTFDPDRDQFIVMNGDQGAMETNVTASYNNSTGALGVQIGSYRSGPLRVVWTAAIAYTDGSITEN